MVPLERGALGWRAAVSFFAAVEGAREIQDVILRAMDRRPKWYQAA